MLGTLKKYKSNKANINQQLYDAIYRKVTKKKHNYPSPQKGDKTITECIEFFKAGANPNILSKLEKPLIGQEKYRGYYINKFLPTLKDEVIKSEELAKLSVFNKETEQSQGPETRKGEIVGIILSIISKGNNIIGDHNNKDHEEELEKPIETLELSGDPGSRASSPVPDKKNPPSSPVSRSVSPTLNHAKKDSDPQIKNKEKTKLEHPTKTRPKGPIGRRLPSKWIKGRVQLEQPAKEEQNMQENENNSEDTPPEKQPNNRNFRVALATCCALSVGCLIAGVVTLGMVGAGLLVMSVVLAIAAAVTRYLTPPSSELTSTDLSPLIDDGKQR